MGAPAPQEIIHWELAEHYGWTLDYVRSLSMADIHEYYQIKDGKTKASRS